MDLQIPRVYGDRLILMLVKVLKELQLMEIPFIEDEQLSSEDEDVQNYARIQNRLNEIYEDVKLDRIRGDTAVERIKTQVAYPFEDLYYRLVESRKFPEFWEMYEFLETYKG